MRESPARSEAFEVALETRERLREKLELEDAEDLLENFGRCGEPIPFVCQCCGQVDEFARRCNRKWCPVCVRALATRASLRYTGITEGFRSPLFVTLTEKNHEGTGFDFIRHMRQSFGRLRHLSWWKSRVRGGVAGIEVTNTGKGWHPHLHMVIDCPWLSVTVPRPRHGCSDAEWTSSCRRALTEITEQWSLSLRARGGVFLKTASGTAGKHGDSIAKEIIKYSVKGSDLVDCKEPIAPVLRMLDGTRLLTSFGSVYGKLKEFDAPKVPCACGTCGETGTYIPQAVADTWIRSEKSGYRK